MKTVRTFRIPLVLFCCVLFSCSSDNRESENAEEEGDVTRGSMSLDLNDARAVIFQKGFTGTAERVGDEYRLPAGVLKVKEDGSAVPAIVFTTNEADVTIPGPAFVTRGTDNRLYMGYEKPLRWQEYNTASGRWKDADLFICRLGYDNRIIRYEGYYEDSWDDEIGDATMTPFDAPWLNDLGALPKTRNTAPVRFSPDGSRMACLIGGRVYVFDGDGQFTEDFHPGPGVADILAGNQMLGIMKVTDGRYTAVVYDGWDDTPVYEPLGEVLSYSFCLWFERNGVLHYSGESIPRYYIPEPGEIVQYDSGLMKWDAHAGTTVIAGKTRACDDPPQGCNDYEYFGFPDQASYYAAFQDRERFEKVLTAGDGALYGLIRVEEHGNVVDIMKVINADDSFSGEVVANDIWDGTQYSIHGNSIFYLKRASNSAALTSLRRVILTGHDDSVIVGDKAGIMIHDYDVDIKHNKIYMIATRISDSAAGYAIHDIGGATVFHPLSGLNSESEILCVKASQNPDNPLSAAISVNEDSGVAPLLAQFDGSAAGGTPPYSYSWDFGNGSTSTEEDPDCSYSAGEYTATLTVTDYLGLEAKATKEISVTQWYEMTVAIDAQLTGEPRYVIAEFSAAISGGVPPYTYKWNFDADSANVCEGMPANSPDNAPNPVHSYCWNGIYTVTLTVEDSNGSKAYDDIAINNRIEGTPLVTVAMEPPLGTGAAPLTVQFSSTVSDGIAPYIYYWSFGDNSPGLFDTPTASHTYDNPGGVLSVPARFQRRVGS